MRHRKSGRKFNMDASARKAMYRNMVTSLMLHGQIKTTEERAKELRRYAEKVITLGKKANAQKTDKVHAIRQAKLWINNDVALAKVFGEYAERFASRPGGYTRVIKMGRRAGDNAAMASILLVDDSEVAVPAANEVKASAGDVVGEE
jgi:large subunit ribosomal protein L17